MEKTIHLEEGNIKLSELKNKIDNLIKEGYEDSLIRINWIDWDENEGFELIATKPDNK